jgi:putative cardiolipin synthase
VPWTRRSVCAMLAWQAPCRQSMPNPTSPPDRVFSCSSVRAALRLLAMCVALLAAVTTQGCASLAPMVKVASKAIAARQNTALGAIAVQSASVADGTGFRALPISSFSMDARIALVNAAQSSIDLQYYLLQNDATGSTLMRAVRDAALRGVRVRILVDDLYTVDSARMLRDLAAYENVEVRLFNPFPAGRSLFLTRWAFSLFDLARVNHRMHNKMLVADGAFAVAGGRNIANEYFFQSDKGNFIDFDLLLCGRAVVDLESIFDLYWNSPRVYPITALETASSDSSALRAEFEQRSIVQGTPFEAPAADARDMLGYAPLSHDLQYPPLNLLHGAVRVFADDPEKVSGRSNDGHDSTTVTTQALAAFDGATSELTLASPYFVPGELGIEVLREARSRNVTTTVITNSLAASDVPFASAAYARYRKSMLKMGVEVYEISSKPPELAQHYGAKIGSIGRSHAKIAVMDRRVTFLGSMNMDFRSSRTNTELGMLIESTELAKQICDLLDVLSATDAFRLSMEQPGDRLAWTITKDGATIVYHDEPDADVGTRLKIFLFSPLVPDTLL